MRISLLVLSVLLAFPLFAGADTRPKATVASVTAKHDRLISVRDKLRELAAQKEPAKLPADHKKAYDKWVAQAKLTADQADALATKLSTGLKDKTQKNLDSMSELAEAESLRLQSVMDRESRLLSALSNALKKFSDAADLITSNLK